MDYVNGFKAVAVTLTARRYLLSFPLRGAIVPASTRDIVRPALVLDSTTDT